MADIDDRWFRADRDPASGKAIATPTARHGKGKRYAARWRDDAGRQKSKSFDRKRDAEAFLAEVKTDLARGSYVDPAAGRVRLRTYAVAWLANQTFDESTREAVELRLRLHVFPTLGAHELRTLKPSTVQAWTRGLQGQLSPGYVRVIFANLSAVLKAAVDDGLISRNPCRAASVRPPAADRRRVIPWTSQRLEAVRSAVPTPYREMVTLGAGVGLRQGEIFGLAVDDIDWLRGVVHVRRQVKIVGSRLVFAPPKRNKERDVPLADSVALRLSAHLAERPARTVTLPWQMPTGKPAAAELLFTTRERQAVNRNYFNQGVWKPALTAAGVPATRENGMHALRHRFASVVLDGGASIRDLADWLGHTDPGFTLRVYTHLMPNSTQRMRGAIDLALSGQEVDSPSQGGAPDVRHTTG